MKWKEKEVLVGCRATAETTWTTRDNISAGTWVRDGIDSDEGLMRTTRDYDRDIRGRNGAENFSTYFVEATQLLYLQAAID